MACLSDLTVPGTNLAEYFLAQQFLKSEAKIEQFQNVFSIWNLRHTCPTSCGVRWPLLLSSPDGVGPSPTVGIRLEKHLASRRLRASPTCSPSSEASWKRTLGAGSAWWRLDCPHACWTWKSTQSPWPTGGLQRRLHHTRRTGHLRHVFCWIRPCGGSGHAHPWSESKTLSLRLANCSENLKCCKGDI